MPERTAPQALADTEKAIKDYTDEVDAQLASKLDEAELVTTLDSLTAAFNTAKTTLAGSDAGGDGGDGS